MNIVLDKLLGLRLSGLVWVIWNFLTIDFKICLPPIWLQSTVNRLSQSSLQKTNIGLAGLDLEILSGKIIGFRETNLISNCFLNLLFLGETVDICRHYKSQKAECPSNIRMHFRCNRLFAQHLASQGFHVVRHRAQLGVNTHDFP